MSDHETQRKRRSSVNRVLATFKAALNLALENHPRELKTSDEWRLGLKPFPKVLAPRVQWLREVEIPLLLNACTADFRELVAAALYTGARYSELARSHVAEFDSEHRSLYVPHSKSGKPRTIYLNAQAVDFFRRVSAGKRGSDLLLVKSDGSPWGKGHQTRHMRQSCIAAGLQEMGFHQLRHSYASIAVKNGLPLQILAHNLGHVDTRMVERHYAHLESEYIREQIAKNTAAFSVDFVGADVIVFDKAAPVEVRETF
jgi:integrase